MAKILISTFSGKQLPILEPEPSQICIEDIAHGLAHTCRFAGQCADFYSVAQHSVLVSKLVGAEDAMLGLLHDASEAFMGDIHSGLKSALPEYKRIENQLLGVIYQRFGLPALTLKPASIALADKQALYLEVVALGMDIALQPMPDLPELRLTPLKPAAAKAEFLRRFDQLSNSQQRKAV